VNGKRPRVINEGYSRIIYECGQPEVVAGAITAKVFKGAHVTAPLEFCTLSTVVWRNIPQQMRWYVLRCVRTNQYSGVPASAAASTAASSVRASVARAIARASTSTTTTTTTTTTTVSSGDEAGASSSVYGAAADEPETMEEEVVVTGVRTWKDRNEAGFANAILID
jgi:hypothetical protein